MRGALVSTDLDAGALEASSGDFKAPTERALSHAFLLRLFRTDCAQLGQLRRLIVV
jgi:hypothetical protein